MKEIIVANFKMNKTYSETKDYIKELNSLVGENAPKICLCLPYTSLYLSKLYKDSKFTFGAQNMHDEEFGAYTGEISAPMLVDLKVKTVILGHSERRKMGENSTIINKKLKTALRFGLEVVLCVGETRAQRNLNKTKQVLEKEISDALSGIYENELKNIIFAYEPIWAIGTGKVAEINDIRQASEIIRKCVSHLYSTTAGKELKFLYGGSITSQVSKQIFALKNVNGALVGGASLNAEQFAELIKK